MDFERIWQAKLQKAITENAGAQACTLLMEGAGRLSSDSERMQVIAWTQEMLERMDAALPQDICRKVLLSCACRYPDEQLRDIRWCFAESGSYGLAHRMLQSRFKEFLRTTLQLSEEESWEMIQRGWGLAGVLERKTIHATKIPKSGNLAAYMQTTDSDARRALYCHCPRVRDAIAHGESVPKLYCYCGAGFYQGIWEGIIQAPVEVQVVHSVLAGDDACTIAVHLP